MYVYICTCVYIDRYIDTQLAATYERRHPSTASSTAALSP